MNGCCEPVTICWICRRQRQFISLQKKNMKRQTMFNSISFIVSVLYLYVRVHNFTNSLNSMTKNTENIIRQHRRNKITKVFHDTTTDLDPPKSRWLAIDTDSSVVQTIGKLAAMDWTQRHYSLIHVHNIDIWYNRWKILPNLSNKHDIQADAVLLQ